MKGAGIGAGTSWEVVARMQAKVQIFTYNKFLQVELLGQRVGTF